MSLIYPTRILKKVIHMDSGCPCDLDRVKSKKAEIMTRNGKIARLPRAIRDELNRRLDDGEPGVQLVNWLNGVPEVRDILRNEFGVYQPGG